MNDITATNEIVTTNFHGAEIYGFRSGRTVLVAVKPIVTGMGLDWPSQHKRIQRDLVLSKGMVIMTIPLGSKQPMVCLDLELLHGWLFTIDTARIKNEVIRDRVLTFQRECYQVLASHFLGDREKIAKEANEAEALSLRLVAEARHIFGELAAAQLWERRGLTKVPAMDRVFRQFELFDDAKAA